MESNDLEIIGKAKNDFCLPIKESLLLQKFKPFPSLVGRVGLYVSLHCLNTVLMCSLLLSISCTLITL